MENETRRQNRNCKRKHTQTKFRICKEKEHKRHDVGFTFTCQAKFSSLSLSLSPMPLDNDGDCSLTELISSILDRIPNLLSFKSKWSSIRVKLADLNTHLSDIPASSSSNQLALDLLLSARETLHNASSVAARCEGPSLSERNLNTQSDVDSVMARLDRHVKDADVLIKSSLLNEIEKAVFSTKSFRFRQRRKLRRGI